MPAQDLGPTGHRLSINVAELREEAGLSLRELSERLSELGRPIPPASLMKIERGTRRVDTDDLIALSLALDVTPNRLLLTKEAGQGPVELTPAVTTPHKVIAWKWGCGEWFIHIPGTKSKDMPEMARFMARNRPHEAGNTFAENEAEFREHREALTPVARAVREAEQQGVPFRTIINYIRMTDAVATVEQ